MENWFDFEFSLNSKGISCGFLEGDKWDFGGFSRDLLGIFGCFVIVYIVKV